MDPRLLRHLPRSIQRAYGMCEPETTTFWHTVAGTALAHFLREGETHLRRLEPSVGHHPAARHTLTWAQQCLTCLASIRSLEGGRIFYTGIGQHLCDTVKNLADAARRARAETPEAAAALREGLAALSPLPPLPSHPPHTEHFFWTAAGDEALRHHLPAISRVLRDTSGNAPERPLTPS